MTTDYTEVSSYLKHKFALVISGDAFSYVNASDERRSKLIHITNCCNVVIGGRFSANQKTKILMLLKSKNKEARILAIGDGVNDISMVHKAHVGVGLHSERNRHMVQLADYSIPEFRYLKRMILAKGREILRRQSKIVIYTFYMSTAGTAIAIFNGPFSQWFGRDNLQIGATQNFFLIFAPCVLLGLFDKEHEKKHLIKHSYLYSYGRAGKYYNKGIFWRTILFGYYTGFVITMVSMLLNENYSNPAFTDSGKVMGLYTSDKLMLYSMFLVGWLNISQTAYKWWIFYLLLVSYIIAMKARTIVKDFV